MKKLMVSLALLALGTTAATAQEAIVQLGPTTPYSTISCANYTKLPDGSWKALNATPFGLGFVHGIVPPVFVIKSGAYIYNNIDLYSQLQEQCGAAQAVVRARF